MNILPNKLTTRKLLSALFSIFIAFAFTLSSVTTANAASSYISPATGLITSESFLVSVYVESTLTEPEISGANVKITYPANVAVVTINEGDFDSYLSKDDDKTLRQINIDAVNTAGNYKSGKVKLASIRFEAIEPTGAVDLTITSDSEVSGAGGEQLLTETINARYTLDLPETAGTDPVDPADPVEEIGATVDNSNTTKGGQTVPETGPRENIVLFLGISLGMILLGLKTIKSPVKS